MTGFRLPGETSSFVAARLRRRYAAPMRAEATTSAPADTGADTIAIGLFEGEPIAHDLDGGVLQALVDSGEAKPGLRKLAVTHAGGKRYVLAGLGKREEFDAERARVAAAARRRPRARARRALPLLGAPAPRRRRRGGRLRRGHAARRLRLPRPQDQARRGRRDRAARALRAPRRLGGRRTAPPSRPTAANAARDLQHAPANEMTPTRLAERAHELAAELGRADRRDDGPGRDRGGRHGRVRRRRARQRRGAAADHAPLRARGRRRARCSASSARP